MQFRQQNDISNDSFYGGDDDYGLIHAESVSEEDIYSSFGRAYESVKTIMDNKYREKTLVEEHSVELYYDKRVIPPFLLTDYHRFKTEENVDSRDGSCSHSSTAVSPSSASASMSSPPLCPVFSFQQTVILPVKDPESSLACYAWAPSGALARYRREQLTRKANKEELDASQSTFRKLSHRLDVEKNVESMTEEEMHQAKGALRMQRMRELSEEKREQMLRDEKKEEVRAMKADTFGAAVCGGNVMKKDEKCREGLKSNEYNSNEEKIENSPYSQNNDNAKNDHKRFQLAMTRISLPIYKCKQQLLQLIKENAVCIILGETGSGKTTQLAQYLLEEGYAPKSGSVMIGCTQPRKVAAVSVATRVAEEVGCFLGEDVGYAIRLEDFTSSTTRLKYMTEGVLLREVIHDPDLNKYSVIICDECHNRTVNLDCILGILKGVLLRRLDLKLIVTSATMSVEKFSDFFWNAPVFTIPGKVFPVNVSYGKHFSSVTRDVIEDVVLKVLEIHLTEPLRVVMKRNQGGGGEATKALEDNKNVVEYDEGKRCEEGNLENDNIDNAHDKGKDVVELDADILVFLSGKDEILAVKHFLEERLREQGLQYLNSLLIVPLYSELPPAQQLKALRKTPKAQRKCVLSTNVAETSLTIDGVRYIVDSGFMKTNVFRPRIGMNSLLQYPISQAEAIQRTGRAGRTAEGVCYRLYTEDEFNRQMLPSPVPEIQRSSIDAVLLLLKRLGVKDLLLFPFLDPPPEVTIRNSLFKLWILGALSSKTGDITPLGVKMSELAMDPSLAKMLISAEFLNCKEEVLSIVALLSTGMRSLFQRQQQLQQGVVGGASGRDEELQQARKHFNVSEGDHLTLLNIFQQFERSGKNQSWCQSNFLDYKTLMHAVTVRAQFIQQLEGVKIMKYGDKAKQWGLHQYINTAMNTSNNTHHYSTSLHTNMSMSECIRKSLVFGYTTQVARAVKWNEFESIISLVRAQLHPTSAVLDAPKVPECVVYHDMLLTSKEYMCVVTSVEAEWVVEATRGVIKALGKGQVGCRWGHDDDDSHTDNKNKNGGKNQCLIRPAPFEFLLNDNNDGLVETDDNAQKIIMKGKGEGGMAFLQKIAQNRVGDAGGGEGKERMKEQPFSSQKKIVSKDTSSTTESLDMGLSRSHSMGGTSSSVISARLALRVIQSRQRDARNKRQREL